jgi:hypothetical protein
MFDEHGPPAPVENTSQSRFKKSTLISRKETYMAKEKPECSRFN